MSGYDAAIRDIVIAETANKLNDTLVSDDEKLRQVVFRVQRQRRSVIASGLNVLR